MRIQRDVALLAKGSYLRLGTSSINTSYRVAKLVVVCYKRKAHVSIETLAACHGTVEPIII